MIDLFFLLIFVKFARYLSCTVLVLNSTLNNVLKQDKNSQMKGPMTFSLFGV